MYLLDTNVISDGTKPIPNLGLQTWLKNTPPSLLFLSVISLGEIRKGIQRQKITRRGLELQTWFDKDLRPNFEGRILPVSEKIMNCWGEICADAISAGQTPPLMDSLLAATAIEHGLILVTRNTDDVAMLPVSVLNPWA